MRGGRVVGSVLIAVALVAAACTSQEAIGDAGDQRSSPTASTATPALTPAPATPQPSATPAPAPLGVERPPTLALPPEWNDPLSVDAAVTEGTLSNGMRYLVLANGAPGGQAQLRLVVHAGSLHEDEGRSGVAHFLEHLLFNGTERFPRNELIRVLESFGSGFGPDVNAYTSYGETVYELEVPARSADSLQLGLDVLHQWATAATLDPQAVIDERGVVREEYRRRAESLGGRIGDEVSEVLLQGTDYVGRDPIGEIEVIETMIEADVRDFYERWYRPDLMSVIAVGDFDVAAMEQRILDTFDGASPPTPTPTLAIALGNGGLPQPTFDVLTDPEVTSSEVEVLWRIEDSPIATPADLRRAFIIDVTSGLLNERLFERTQTDPVLISAGASHGGLTPAHQLVNVTAQAEPVELDAALTAVLTEVERARQFGFGEREFDDAVLALETAVEQEFAQRGTRQDEDIAAELVAYAVDGSIAASAEDRRRVALEVLASITPADLQAFLFDLLAAEPYVLVTAPADDEAEVPTPTDLAALYDKTVGAPAEPRVAERERTVLMERPDVETASFDLQRIGKLGAVVVTYPNGARLAFRHTDITENRVHLNVVSLGGFFAVEGPVAALLNRVPGISAESGFESIDIVDLRRALTGSSAGVSASIGRAAERIEGEAAADDLEVLFQLVHLEMTEPTLSDSAIRRFDAALRPLVENPRVRPEIAADLELWRLRYGDSPWFQYLPTVEDLDGFDPDLLLDAYKDRFADAGDFIFVVVGDFDESTLLDLGTRYIGTLPDRGRRDEPIDRDPGVPEQNLVATVEAGIGDQGQVRINWESPYPFTQEAEIAAEALELIVDARLRDLIREELGAAYSPSTDVVVLSEPKPWIDTVIEVQTDPERVEEVSKAIRAEVERLRNGELDPIYLELVVDQLVEGYRFTSNAQWIDRIEFHLLYPERDAGEFERRKAIAEALTIDDVAEVARAAFPPTRSVEVRLVPAG